MVCGGSCSLTSCTEQVFALANLLEEGGWTLDFLPTTWGILDSSQYTVGA